jgi:hypothetical protein
LLIAALLMLVVAPIEAMGQENLEITVEPLLGRIYPPDRWLPLKVKLSNPSDARIDGTVIIPLLRPAASMQIPASVPAKSVVTLTAYAYLPATALKPDAGAQSSPVAIVEWHSANGARLARSELLAQPDTAGKSDTGDNPNVPGYLVLSVLGGREMRDSELPVSMVKQIAPEIAYPLNLAECEVASLPRACAGYGGVRVVVLSGVSPDELDLMQRESLLDFVRGGGTLVLPAPLDDADPSTTWLAPYLPVQAIGKRNTSSIASVERGELKLVEDSRICEAIAGTGEVLLRDASLVHAAWQRVGLGRIVFTSFPISSLDPGNPAAIAFWRDALQLDAPMPGWSSRAIAQQQNELMEAMVGAPAAPFRHAVWIVAGYALLTLLPQCFVRGARRPVAFLISIIASIAITCGVFVVSGAKTHGQPSLTMGRLATIELASSGGGIRTELVTLIGQDNPDLSLSSDSLATLRPVASSESDPPVIEQPPFTAPHAGVRAGRIDRLWQASAAVDASRRLICKVQMRADGLYASIDNQTRHQIGSPLLIWNRSAYRLPDLPVGSIEVKLPGKNPAGDFSNVALVTGETASLRARIVHSMVSPRTDTAGALVMQFPPVIAGWIDAGGSGLASPLIQSNPPSQASSQNILVTAPAILVASPAGTMVQVPSDCVVPQGDAAKGVLFDPATGQWLQSMLASSWRIGFAIPKDAGPLLPVRVRIHADLAAEKHKVSLRRGQCQGGVPGDDPNGPVVAEWDRVIGPRDTTFDIGPSDLDANGCLWLRLTVESSGASGDIIQPQWKLNRFDVEFDAR